MLPSDKNGCSVRLFWGGGRLPLRRYRPVGRYASTPSAGTPRNAPSMRATNERDAVGGVPYNVNGWIAIHPSGGTPGCASPTDVLALGSSLRNRIFAQLVMETKATHFATSPTSDTQYRRGRGGAGSPTKKSQIEEIQIQADAVAIEIELDLARIHLCLTRAIAIGNGDLVEVDRVIRIAEDIGKEL